MSPNFQQATAVPEKQKYRVRFASSRGSTGPSAARHRLPQMAGITGLAGVGLLSSLALALPGIAWIAGAELIYLLIDIEANTRFIRPPSASQT
jgi:hypothetical protein